jgi:hypothetical protein
VEVDEVLYEVLLVFGGSGAEAALHRGGGQRGAGTVQRVGGVEFRDRDGIWDVWRRQGIGVFERGEGAGVWETLLSVESMRTIGTIKEGSRNRSWEIIHFFIITHIKWKVAISTTVSRDRMLVCLVSVRRGDLRQVRGESRRPMGVGISLHNDLYI